MTSPTDIAVVFRPITQHKGYLKDSSGHSRSAHFNIQDFAESYSYQVPNGLKCAD